jgi:hypothetical protein
MRNCRENKPQITQIYTMEEWCQGIVPGKLFLMDGFQEGDPCPEDRRQKTDDR